MKFFHLSHTDLDGYAAQFVSNFYIKNVHNFNSNYGHEIDEKFELILNKLNDEKSLILISDLNLTLSQCEKFSQKIAEKNAKIILLDHHISGIECVKNYSWYFMDSSRCATKIVYDLFSKIFGENDKLHKLVNVVNAADIWLKDDADFELGKVCLGLISGAKELNKVMFANENFEYLQFLISKICGFINMQNAHIALDSAVHSLKKEFFKSSFDDTLGNLISHYVVERLSARKDELSVIYKDKKGILTYNIGSTSIIGNDFLVNNPDIDFFVDITSKKTLSFRANGNADVSLIAKNLVGGGGHINASGGLFGAFKDCNDYTNIKAQFQNLIDQKTKEE